MSKRDRLFLGHVLDAIAAIESFTTEGRAHFMTDLKTQSAVVRQLEIIGEAVKQLSAELTAAEKDIPWRQIAGTRDRLIHAYFKVDLDAVWAMAEQDLAPLKSTVQRILGGDQGRPEAPPATSL
jgi:uncharacterized protein with HEPN domain